MFVQNPEPMAIKEIKGARLVFLDVKPCFATCCTFRFVLKTNLAHRRNASLAPFAVTSRRIRRGELTGKPPFTTSAFVVESSMATKTRRLMAPGTIGMSGSRRARSGKSRTLCLRVGTWLSNFATFRQGSYEIGGCRSQAQSKTKSLVSTTVSTEKYEPGPFDFCLLHISFCPENELGSSEKCEPGPFCANIGGHFGAVLLGKRMDIGLLILGLRLGCLNLRAVYELKASLAPFICIAIPGETLPIKWT
jgi:hypothetical protein